jgi:hypothetical protein
LLWQDTALRYQEIRAELDAELANITAITGTNYNTTALKLVDEMLNHLKTMGLCNVPDPDHLNWTFLGSSYFAMTLFTTIGYGTFAPQTSGGKAFTCIFGVVGIALFGWYLAVVMPIMSKMEQWIVKRCTSSTDGKLADHYKRLALNVVLCFAFTLTGSIFSHRNQNISYADGFYFSIVSLTTIGLGDFAPNARMLNGWGYLAYTTWIYFGIAFMSYIITIIADIALESMGLDVFNPSAIHEPTSPKSSGSAQVEMESASQNEAEVAEETEAV